MGGATDNQYAPIITSVSIVILLFSKTFGKTVTFPNIHPCKAFLPLCKRGLTLPGLVLDFVNVLIVFWSLIVTLLGP